MKRLFFITLAITFLLISCEKEQATYTHWRVASYKYIYELKWCEEKIPLIIYKDIGLDHTQNNPWQVYMNYDQTEKFGFEDGYEYIIEIKKTPTRECSTRDITRIISKYKADTHIEEDDLNLDFALLCY